MGYFMKNKNKITGIALLGVFASFALLGTIFALGRVINKVSTINFDIASIVLSSLTILLMIFNLIYSDIRQNKIKKMTNQDKLDYSLKMKKWVKDNILLLRNKRIKEYKLAISYGIFNYFLLHLLLCALEKKTYLSYFLCFCFLLFYLQHLFGLFQNLIMY